MRIFPCFLLAFVLLVTACGSTQDSGPSGGDSDYNWREHIALVDVPAHTFSGNTFKSAVFQDVMGHTRQPYLVPGDPMTSVHETLHFMLHENDGRTSESDKFIFASEGKGAFLLEPRTLTSAIVGNIPEFVRKTAPRYGTYVSSRPSQTLGENIFDEWKAYIVEGLAAAEMEAARTWQFGRYFEGVAAVEFLYFCSAALLTLSQQESDYLADQNFKAIFAMMAEESRSIVDSARSSQIFETSTLNQLMNHFQTSKEAEGIRGKIVDYYGATWAKRVLGI